MTDILITQTFVEALTQNVSADVRVTGMAVEAMVQIDPADVDVLLTATYVEVLQASTGAELRFTNMYVEVLQETTAEGQPASWVWMGDGIGGKIWIE